MTNPDDPLARALRHIEVAPRMSRMAELFGASAAMPLIERWRSDEMTEHCADCRHKSDCDTLLSDPGAPADNATFCPNHGHFRAIAARGH